MKEQQFCTQVGRQRRGNGERAKGKAHRVRRKWE